jgi:hypothetical protein
MKKYFFLMIILCLVSNVAYSMHNNNIQLDPWSEGQLIERVKAENVDRGYWPEGVVVTLEKLCKISGNNGVDTKYFVRAVGRYDGYVDVQFTTGATERRPARLGKATEGYFKREELESFGLQLPD